LNKGYSLLVDFREAGEKGEIGKKYGYHNYLLEIRQTWLPDYRLNLLLGHVLGCAVAQQRRRHLEFEVWLSDSLLDSSLKIVFSLEHCKV
jgi:hypothetical protein